MISQLWQDKLIELQAQFTTYTKDFKSKNPYVFRFWQDSFTRYLRKMRLPEFPNTKHPRRYFHLSAVDYLLNKSKPLIVWNLCPGNIKTLLPAIDRWIARNQAHNQDYTPLLWINIDILPELQRLNTEILEQHGNVNRLALHDQLYIVKYKQSFIVNIQGTFEEFPVVYKDLQLQTLHSQQILLCVDGFPNTIRPPAEILNWWDAFQTFMNSVFQGWYFTWLNAESLETKFAFYFDVVLKKHKHPIYWLEATPLRLISSTNSLEIFHEEVVSTPLELTTYHEIQQQISGETAGWIFRFFSDSKQTNMVYQAMYVKPEVMNNLINSNEFLSRFNISNYKYLDQILFPSDNDEPSSHEKTGFIKTIPVLVIK